MTTEWVPLLWRETFEEMLNEDNELDYDDTWTMNFNYQQTNTVTQDERRRGWKIFTPCAFGSFLCNSCHKSWSSARVGLLFRYRLRSEAGRGTVIMRPMGQACRTCNGEFYLPGFTDDAVTGVLQRLFTKIRKNCYNEEDDDEDHDDSPKVVTKPHLKNLCEACQLGICCQDE